MFFKWFYKPKELPPKPGVREPVISFVELIIKKRKEFTIEGYSHHFEGAVNVKLCRYPYTGYRYAEVFFRGDIVGTSRIPDECDLVDNFNLEGITITKDEREWAKDKLYSHFESRIERYNRIKAIREERLENERREALTKKFRSILSE